MSDCGTDLADMLFELLHIRHAENMGRKFTSDALAVFLEIPDSVGQPPFPCSEKRSKSKWSGRSKSTSRNQVELKEPGFSN